VAALDLCLSLHRSEGFGYSLAEAMWLGVPAVATRYSGNLDFMDDDNSWLVRATEVLVRKPEGPFRRGTVWAEADVAEAAAHCRAIYEDRDGARRRAARGRETVRRALGVDAVARRLEGLLA
jgi:glycosyltransferase involved in cell wall biosynthesis